MNEKITKKIGEAHAFADVLKITHEANQSVMDSLLGELSADVVETVSAQATALRGICEAAGTVETLTPKVAKTSEKITKMGEMYVGDDWDDSAEVLEWMSFFVGGAIVHWELIVGAGQAMDHSELTETASAGVTYYESLMRQLKVAAVQVGTERAQ